MNTRRFFLQSGLAGTAAFVAPGFASAVANARPDAPSTTPFGNNPVLTPLRGWVDGQDRMAEGLRVQGRIPAALQGTLYRNGPGLMERAGQRYRHWFDGDGLVQAWQFGPSGVSHTARFVQTRKFKEEQKASSFLLPAFGTAVPPKLPVRGSDDVNVANTSVTVQNGKLYALWEGGSATELDPTTLATVGLKTWAPELSGAPFSAHPKREPDGTLWNFGTFMGKLVIYQISAAGQLQRSQILDLPTAAMMHDFALSQRYITFLVSPLSLDMAALREGASMVTAMRWDAKAPMRVVIIDKASLKMVRQLELPPELVFHFGNAWDDSAQGGHTLRLNYVKNNIDEFLTGRMNDMMGGTKGSHGALSTPQFLSINLQTGQIQRQARPEAVEFPQVDPRVVSQRNRYVYYPTRRGLDDRWGFNALQRLDIENGRTEVFSFGANTVLEEHLLIPKPGSSCEGQGWLIGTGFDAQRQRSFATVFDAEAISAGPLAQVWLPYWVPLGFHGCYRPTA